MKWISVKDRLPEPWIWILLCSTSADNAITIGLWNENTKLFMFGFAVRAVDGTINSNVGCIKQMGFGWLEPQEVTHWMALPEGPENL